MNEIKNIFNSKGHAENYDKKVENRNWCGPEIIFEMVEPYLKPNDNILDFGIGTGKTSEPFLSSEINIYGMDFSESMLQICKNKNITQELKIHDLNKTPYPYISNSMDHIICGGVLHIFEDLSPIFIEAARILSKKGTFAFTCAHHSNKNCDTHKYTTRKHMGKNIYIYQHNKKVVEEALIKSGFILQRTVKFKISQSKTETSIQEFNAFIATLG